MIENGKYRHYPYEVYTYSKVDSTNSIAKRAVMMVGSNADYTAHVAGEQSAGRGRQGRTWFNTPGAVLMSIVKRTDISFDELPMLNLAAALAVKNAVALITESSLVPVVKWPNDVLTSDRLEKLCGILSESVTLNGDTYAIIGLGLNLNCKDMPSGLLQPATSVCIKTGMQFPIPDAVNAILDEFEIHYKRLIKSSEAFLKDYAACCVSIGRRVSVNEGGNIRYGMGFGLAEDGRLTVKFEDGSVEIISAADVSIRSMCITDEALAKKLMPKRRFDFNKGDLGRAALIVGSDNMPGAALMCTKACLRSGAGLTRVLVPDSIRPMFSVVPEAMLCSDNEADELFSWATAIGVGCGMGASERTYNLVKKALLTKKPCVVDADALNTISKYHELLSFLHGKVIITPHPGEMGRLIGKTAKYAADNPTATASGFAKEYGCTVLLKSAVSVIASPDGAMRYNESGSNALSKGGSGDVLTGIIAALMAQGLSPFDAGTLGAYLLGVSAVKAIDLLNNRFITASDITDAIGSEIIERSSI